MEEIKLDVQIRNDLGKRKVKKARRENTIPPVVYGGKGGNTVIKIDRKNFERIMRQHKGESVVFHLNIMENGKKLRDYSVLVNELQHHPVNDEIRHVDFKRISLTEKVVVKVGIVTKGDPIGVKKDGGSLEHVLWELDVECLPLQIPQHIDIEVGHLNIHDAIHVWDLKIPAGIEVKNDPEAIVVTVAPPMKEVLETPGEAPPEPEVLREKKPAAGEEAEEAKKTEGSAKKAEAAPAAKKEGEK